MLEPAGGHYVGQGEQRLFVLRKTVDRLLVFGPVFLGEGVHGDLRCGAGLAFLIYLRSDFIDGCMDFGKLFRTLAILWAQHL
jgi:hypothetical protein